MLKKLVKNEMSESTKVAVGIVMDIGLYLAAMVLDIELIIGGIDSMIKYKGTLYAGSGIIWIWIALMVIWFEVKEMKMIHNLKKYFGLLVKGIESLE